MRNVTDRRPFDRLGDQQLLDQTQRLVANKRALEVHILDHLAEIDQRGLALRRGFSSLFDYAVRELRFSDASAQRRIQTMRLCRRHNWARADLQSGKLNLTSAAQWETAIARAERQSRQQTSGAAVCQRGETQPPPGGWTRDAVGSDPVAPVASAPAPAQPPVARTGEPVEPADSVASVDVAVADSCVPPVTPAAGAPIEPVAALSRTACAAGAAPTGAPQSESDTEDRGNRDSRDAQVPAIPSTGELPDAVAPAALLDPQRQRELIKQAAGMSTRELAGMIATVSPDVARPRDTLRAVGSERYTLKVNIDEECERGLRLLKDLLSHLDPRMSWGDLVARVVSEAVERHDPRRGGRSRGRRSSSDEESSQRKQPADGDAGPTERPTPSAVRVTPAPQSEPVATHRRREQSAVTAPSTGADRQRTIRAHPVGVHGVAAPRRASAARTPAPQAGPVNSPDSTGTEVAAMTAFGTSAPVTPSTEATPAPQFGRADSLSGAHRDVETRAWLIAASAPQAGPDSAVKGARAGTALANDEIRGGAPRPRRAARRRAIPAAVRRFVWHRDQGRCCYRDPLTGRRCNSSHLLQIDHLLPVSQGGGAEPSNLRLACFAHHKLRHKDELEVQSEPPI